MIELSRHIECLMLKHDCVIVPGLGGFVTQYVPARYVSDEQLFLPPYRSVGFNSQLTLNDGLLVQSYMQAYGTDYSETLKLIDDAVMQLKNELQEKGEYELSGIGKLIMGIEGTYNFIPCEAGVLSPELYGLDAVNVAAVKHTVQAEEQEKAIEKEKKRKIRLHRSEKSYTITLNRELVNYVAAAVIAVFFYFIWAVPVGDTSDKGAQTASVLYQQLFNSSTQQAAQKQQVQLVSSVNNDTPINLMEDADKDNTIGKDAAEGSIVSNMPHIENNALVAMGKSAKSISKDSNDAKSLSKGSYTIVLASAITLDNAKAMSNKLKAQGIQGVQPYKHGSMVRVVCGQYKSKQQAQQALSKFQENKFFSEAWIMEEK